MYHEIVGQVMLFVFALPMGILIGTLTSRVLRQKAISDADRKIGHVRRALWR